jgi:hypothetical protein
MTQTTAETPTEAMDPEVVDTAYDFIYGAASVILEPANALTDEA